MLELFKIKDGKITSVEAVFIQVPYYMRSPWTEPERRRGGLSEPPARPPASPPAPGNPPLTD